MAKDQGNDIDNISFLDDDPERLIAIADSIANDRSVLILGPLFAIDSAGKKISQEFENSEFQKYNKENSATKPYRKPFQLDSDFPNMFLWKVPGEELFLKKRISIFYKQKSLELNKVFEEASSIRFSAVISFTTDSFLPETFMKKGYDFAFGWYCSGEQGKFKPPVDPATAPYLYNLYGLHTDRNAQIAEYDPFYKFLFTILGNEPFLPKELIEKISSAETLLFLGFDLKHPFVPILINKLIRLSMSSGRQGGSVTAAASLNDTDTENAAYLQWLEKYPLKLHPLRNSYDFIERVLGIRDLDILRKSITPNPISAAKQNSNIKIPGETARVWKTEIGNSDTRDSVKSICTDMGKFAQSNSITQMYDSCVLLTASVNTLKMESAMGLVKDDAVKLQSIRASLIELINIYS